MEKSKTLGEIAKEKGFNSLSDMYNALNKAKLELKIFKSGDIVVLPSNYKPTHFKDEAVLPTDSDLIVTEVSTPDIFCTYFIKIEGYSVWFRAEIFKLKE